MTPTRTACGPERLPTPRRTPLREAVARQARTAVALGAIDATGGAAGQALHVDVGEEGGLSCDGGWVVPFGSDGGSRVG